MSGHTPGPWKIWYAGENEGLTQAECIAESNPVVSIGPINYTEFDHEGEEVERANARLIAAAPELYDCLRTLVRQIDEWEQAVAEIVGERKYPWGDLERATDVLLKAEGR